MPETVLVVEDETDLAGLLKDILVASGYNVTVATPSKAAGIAAESRPAAIVLDYLMPGLTGAEVMEQIRLAMPGHAPPVILVTGLSNAAELAEETGAEAYLRKPFNLDEFVDRVDGLTGKQRP